MNFLFSCLSKLVSKSSVMAAQGFRKTVSEEKIKSHAISKVSLGIHFPQIELNLVYNV